MLVTVIYAASVAALLGIAYCTISISNGLTRRHIAQQHLAAMRTWAAHSNNLALQHHAGTGAPKHQ